MTTAVRIPGRKAGLAADRRFVEAVLDELAVTERAYHHLNFSVPLVAELVRRTRRTAGPGDRVLLIGGCTLLGECLVRLGLEVEMWQFEHAYSTDGVKPLVSRVIEPATLLDFDPAGGPGSYTLILAPLVIEATPGPAETFLRRLRPMLTPGGRAIIATANQARLETRLAALAGKPLGARAAASAVSLSWPALNPVHEYHASELTAAARAAGFRVRAVDHVVSERSFLEMEPLNLFDYARRKVRGAIVEVLPQTRDTLVLELSPRVGDGITLKTRSDRPFVSVFVAANKGGEHLRDTLGALLAQTYDSERYEVVVLHDRSRPEVPLIVAEFAGKGACIVRDLVHEAPDGPEARNLAMAESNSDIAAHTDDSCYLPDDWIQAAVAWFDADTAVVTGPVFLRDGSESRFLAVPCTRPDPDEKGVSSRSLFYHSNVFYRTPIAIAAGGFDRRFAQSGDGVPAVGWDTELAWRLQRGGWAVRFRDEVYQFRTFPPKPGRFGVARGQVREASEVPAMMARVPEYARTTLVAGVFASKQTMYFDMALAAVLTAGLRREWPWLVGAAPWLAMVSHRLDLWPPSSWPGSLRMLARATARQGAWLAGFIQGSVKARKVVL